MLKSSIKEEKNSQNSTHITIFYTFIESYTTTDEKQRSKSRDSTIISTKCNIMQQIYEPKLVLNDPNFIKSTIIQQKRNQETRLSIESASTLGSESRELRWWVWTTEMGIKRESFSHTNTRACVCGRRGSQFLRRWASVESTNTYMYSQQRQCSL